MNLLELIFVGFVGWIVGNVLLVLLAGAVREHQRNRFGQTARQYRNYQQAVAQNAKPDIFEGGGPVVLPRHAQCGERHRPWEWCPAVEVGPATARVDRS